MANPRVVHNRPTPRLVRIRHGADAPPKPLGCRWCGHPPYAHDAQSLPHRRRHEWEHPTNAQMRARLDARRRLGLCGTPPASPARPPVHPLATASVRPSKTAPARPSTTASVRPSTAVPGHPATLAPVRPPRVHPPVAASGLTGLHQRPAMTPAPTGRGRAPDRRALADRRPYRQGAAA
ncbi:hypothetical protein Sme01_34490 [Sphaerisporangium melleum]|uniref:Uncharacterized protein n=1 Tax=Sphaerisporangium melleum TaxID=321316 RepID=A0A917VGX4_9ACTN|nr:hypothetical protein GCM10007964_17170 [Sphaerisporangium melleum]GII70973.1 hypothetical protein Sme01_34490 [Sphaerisporangium melleum]